MLKFLSINVNGLRDKSKVDVLSCQCSLLTFDVLLLQETHFTSVDEGFFVAESMRSRGFFSFGTPHSSGVAILINKYLEAEVSGWHQEGGRLIYVDFLLCRQSFRVVCVYGPNDHVERKAFLASLHSHLGGNRIVILGGDFNFVEDLSLDKTGGDPRAGNIGRAQMGQIRSDFHLTDTFRLMFPSRRAFSFSGHNVSTRLDRIYFDSRHADCILQASIVPSTFSDHSFVTLMLSSAVFRHVSGPGFWKCNTNILLVKDLQDEVCGVWDLLKRSPVKNATWWENCKVMFKRTLRSFSIRQACLHRERFSTLSSQVALFQDLCAEDPSRYQDVLIVLKEELRLLVEGRAFGARVRSRALFLSQEEKPSRYFLRLESFKGCNKYISELEKPDGSMVSDKDSLLYTCREYYKNLLSAEKVSRSFEDPFYEGIKKLSPEQSSLCDGDLTYEECLLALKQRCHSCLGKK